MMVFLGSKMLLQYQVPELVVSTVFIYLLTKIYKHAVWVNCSCS
jgi:hypothetical protein